MDSKSKALRRQGSSQGSQRNSSTSSRASSIQQCSTPKSPLSPSYTVSTSLTSYSSHHQSQVFQYPESKSPGYLHSPKVKSPRSPRSPISPRSVKSYSSHKNEDETYFNFNLPSTKKSYSSHAKVVYQQSRKNTTPSLEFKVSNVDIPIHQESSSPMTSPRCTIRSNPCFNLDDDFYTSSSSVNETISDNASGNASGNVSGRPQSANRCRKSTSDLTDVEEVDHDSCRSVSRPSSPRRKGSIKGGLAYLASRRSSRGSRDSLASNFSNEDVGPLNFQNTVRGRQRRTSNFLELPVPDHARPRVCSLPEKAYNPRFSDDLYRLRTFSITNKGGVVNCGDSILNRRSRSNTSVNSTASRASNVSGGGERSPFDGSCCGSGYHTVDSTPLGSPEEREIPKYRIVLLGESGVGKTALVSQFMTSEYMNTYDASLDDEFGEKTVSILLDNDESDLVFIDHPASEMSVENSLSTYEPHACVVVYSITSRESFHVAEDILNYLWRERYTHDKSVIVVGNKADLARSRVISTNDGKALAVSRDCKFIETSSGIQHNVDELLVGVLKQIRLRETRDKKLQLKKSGSRQLHGSKTSLSLNIAREILQKICMNDISKKLAAGWIKSCRGLDKIMSRAVGLPSFETNRLMTQRPVTCTAGIGYYLEDGTQILACEDL